MIPTVWSLFFDSQEFPTGVARGIQVSAEMEGLHRELQGIDPTLSRSAEQALRDSFPRALDVPLVDLMMRAWSRHPKLESMGAGDYEQGERTLIGLGEHEIVSTHRPRVDVIGPAGTLASFQFDLRLEFMIQGATLQIDGRQSVANVSIGACRGTGTLTLEDREVASFTDSDIRFPDLVPVEFHLPTERSLPPMESIVPSNPKRNRLLGLLRRS